MALLNVREPELEKDDEYPYPVEDYAVDFVLNSRLRVAAGTLR